MILLAGENEVIIRNMAYDPDRFDSILSKQKASPSSLNLDKLSEVNLNKQKLYIKLEGGLNPNILSLNVSRVIDVIDLQANTSHWIFRNMELRHGSNALIRSGPGTQNITIDRR